MPAARLKRQTSPVMAARKKFIIQCSVPKRVALHATSSVDFRFLKPVAHAFIQSGICLHCLSAHIAARVRAAMNINLIVCAGVLLLAGSAAAQDGGKAIPKTTISLGTATPGGGFPLYGNAFAEVMNAADATLAIEPRNTKGSNENIPLLEAGGLDIALVAGEPSYEAFMGIARPATRLKILTAMYSSPGMFVVRADSPYR